MRHLCAFYTQCFFQLGLLRASRVPCNPFSRRSHRVRGSQVLQPYLLSRTCVAHWVNASKPSLHPPSRNRATVHWKGRGTFLPLKRGLGHVLRFDQQNAGRSHSVLILSGGLRGFPGLHFSSLFLPFPPVTTMTPLPQNVILDPQPELNPKPGARSQAPQAEVSGGKKFVLFFLDRGSSSA